MLNLIPILVADIFVWVLSASGFDADTVLGLGMYVIAAQCFIVMPLYYVITLAVCHFKYGLKILKGFALQVVILLSTMPIFLVISMIFYFFETREIPLMFEDVLSATVDIRGWLEFADMYISPALAIMLPGTVIIAVVSYVRKKKQITADRNDTEK